MRVWCWPGNTTRLAADPPGQGRAAGLDAGEGHLGGRPRVHLRGQPPPPGRRRRTATSWARSCAPGSAEATAALARPGRYQDVTANLRVKEVKVSEHRAVRGLPQPRRRRPRRRGPGEPRRPARSDDRRLGPALARPSRAELRGVISTQPGLNRFLRVTPGGLLRVDAAKIAADAKLDGKYLLRTVRSAPVHRGHRAGLQAAARGRTRLAGHEAGPGPAPGLPPARGPHPRPRPALLARAAARPDRRDPGRHPRRGHDLAARPRPSCNACTSARSPARPGCSARPPRPAPRPAGCTTPSTSPCRRGSSTSTPSSPQRADQAQHPGLVTRHVTRPTPVRPAQHPHPGTFSTRSCGTQDRAPAPINPRGLP